MVRAIDLRVLAHRFERIACLLGQLEIRGWGLPQWGL